jgi:hypothetical protein
MTHSHVTRVKPPLGATANERHRMLDSTEDMKAQRTTTINVYDLQLTPVGFPLARYSHRAPREGRSL